MKLCVLLNYYLVLSFTLRYKSLTTFRTRTPVETKLSSISLLPFRLQYKIEEIFVLYLNNKLTSSSLVSLRLFLPTYRVINGVVTNYKVVTVRKEVMKVVLYCFLRVPCVKVQT